MVRKWAQYENTRAGLPSETRETGGKGETLGIRVRVAPVALGVPVARVRGWRTFSASC